MVVAGGETPSWMETPTDFDCRTTRLPVPSWGTVLELGEEKGSLGFQKGKAWEGRGEGGGTDRTGGSLQPGPEHGGSRGHRGDWEARPGQAGRGRGGDVRTALELLGDLFSSNLASRIGGMPPVTGSSMGPPTLGRPKSW